MGKKLPSFGKMRGEGKSLGADWSRIHYWKNVFSWRHCWTKKKKRIGPQPPRLWFRTRHTQAAATSRCCRTALGRWMTTGYWGSCGNAGPPCCTRWPGGSPNRASFCGQTKETREPCVRHKCNNGLELSDHKIRLRNQVKWVNRILARRQQLMQLALNIHQSAR